MEKARVLLVPSHKRFAGGVYGDAHHESDVDLTDAVELTEEMLSADFYNGYGVLLGIEHLDCCSNALKAMLQLAPFTSIISMSYATDEQQVSRFRLAHRTWGKMYYQGHRIANFTHDADREHRPFSFIYEWGGYENGKDPLTFSTEQWRGFFLSKISDGVQSRMNLARNMLSEAQASFEFGQATQEALKVIQSVPAL